MTTHIPAREPRGLDLFVRLVYRMARRRLGRVPAPIAVMAHHRRVLGAVGAFELGLESAGQAPTPLKLLAEVMVASRVGCRFCIDIGASIAQRSGISPTQLLALGDYQHSELFTPLERMVLAYAEDLSATPSRSDRARFTALEQALGREGLIELTAAIAWENFRARFNHAVGAEEEGFSETALCMLPARAADPSPALHSGIAVRHVG